MLIMLIQNKFLFQLISEFQISGILLMESVVYLKLKHNFLILKYFL